MTIEETIAKVEGLPADGLAPLATRLQAASCLVRVHAANGFAFGKIFALDLLGLIRPDGTAMSFAAERIAQPARRMLRASIQADAFPTGWSDDLRRALTPGEAALITAGR